jgi:ABC-type sugar transport system permease subunit
MLAMEKFILSEKKKANIKEKLFILALLFYPLANFAVFYIGVNANSILLAFQNVDIDGKFLGLTLNNFKIVYDKVTLTGGEYVQGFKNSIIWYLISTFFSFTLTILFAYYVYKKRIFGKTFKLIIMLPAIISPVCVALMFEKFVGSLPVFFSTLGVQLPNFFRDSEYVFGTNLFYSLWGSFGSSVLIYSNTMTGIDSGVVESARIDGVTNVQEIWYITIPLLMPTIATYITTGVVSILGNQGPLYLFYEYDAPYETTLVGYLMFKETMRLGSQNYPVMSAMGMIMTVITFPVVMLVKNVMQKLDPTN